MHNGGTLQPAGAVITQLKEGESESVGKEETHGRLYHTEAAATHSRAQGPGHSVHRGSRPSPAQSCCVDGEEWLGHLCSAKPDDGVSTTGVSRGADAKRPRASIRCLEPAVP
ncbi:hypothetical protein MRX96_047669 [Rhipicephalus microplus]